MFDINNFDVSVIYTRADGSYVINQGTYHVPDLGEWKELYKQVHQYAQEHPEVVQPEPPYEEPELTPEEKLNQDIFEYQNYLNSTDWYLVRSLETGAPVPEEVTQKRAEARIAIDALREQLGNLD